MLAVPTPAHGGSPEAVRGAARRLAREALCAALACELGCAAQDIAITDQRGEAPRASADEPALAARLAVIGLSISHAPGLSLVAWRPAGAVGVDVQAVDEVATLAADERERTARLYLGPVSWPNRPSARAGKAPTAIDSIVFAQRWAALEARLKCLGERLQEWSPDLQARLAGCTVHGVNLPAPWAAAVAWRPQTKVHSRI